MKILKHISQVSDLRPLWPRAHSVVVFRKFENKTRLLNNF